MIDRSPEPTAPARKPRLDGQWGQVLAPEVPVELDDRHSGDLGELAREGRLPRPPCQRTTTRFILVRLRSIVRQMDHSRRKRLEK